MGFASKSVQRVLNAFGMEVRRIAIQQNEAPVELSPQELKLVERIRNDELSMTSIQRLWATLMACKHVVSQNIAGDFVECGVWRGGNALIAAALFDMYKVTKNIFLFDTFEGMTIPTEKDVKASNSQSAMNEYLRSQRETHNDWCYASLDDVKNNFSKFGLMNERVVFVKGDVCETLNSAENLPEKISVLRLDTDWYESTKRELEVLYPRVSAGGVLIIDDYGHWAGAKRAVDEYFAQNGNRPFLQYIDYTGRLAVKLK